MMDANIEMQEKLKKLTIKIVKHYRGKGPEYVKVNMLDEKTIIIEVKGILSNLSEILVNEGATSMVAKYWEVLKPHIENNFFREIKMILGSNFQYSWKLYNLENHNRTIQIKINLID
ncbi:Na-translocating system protein MpsC family protein [Clostridium sp.]|jgi:uncharacterized protein YbcI|uniref:Na-translocating system protein MpsC family protein n=1 Tax=Clostridium sp. TaxID=1506 RepID=UPI00258C1318|nr:Na-translocating system protein MpsC family protein [Clostridium sp.]